jgi:predicted component of type VI protein secretion system
MIDLLEFQFAAIVGVRLPYLFSGFRCSRVSGSARHAGTIGKGRLEMEAKLRIIAGPFPGETIQVSAGKLLVGRAPDCDVHAKSEFVSGHHCLFLLDEQTFRIRDLGSKNGTLVNGRRIGTIPVNLAHDDIVSIGDIYFLVDLKHATAATAPGQSQTGSPALPSALQGTAVFSGDTVQAKRSDQTQAKPETASLPPVPASSDPDPVPPTSAPNP